MKTTAYPRCRALGLRIFDGCVPFSDLNRIARKKGKRWANRFDRLFGVQTVCAQGLFAWDVEAVLERMASGRRTGSQLLWD